MSYNNAINTVSSINNLSQQIQYSIYRLSSGESQAYGGDDVAASALGNSFSYQLDGIKAALVNTSQASAVLEVANGAVVQISLILNQMQSLASQASSGAVTDTDRASINIQFQEYINEIDRIASTTSFNNINLLDGSLSNSSIIQTNSSYNATAASGIATLAQPLANNEAISITTASGQTVSFTGINTGVFTHPLLEIDITTYTTAAAQATQIANQIVQILDYSGTDTTILSAKAALSQFSISNSASGKLTITALDTGTIGNSVIVQSSSTTASNFLLNGYNAANNAGLTLGGSGTPGANGALNAGTFSSGTTAFSGTATTIATGVIGNSILMPLVVNNKSTTSIDASAISNNSAFTGTISNISASYISSNLVDISINVGDINYVANAVNTNFASNTLVTFASQTAGAGFLNLQFSGGNGLSVSNQTDANSYANSLVTAFSTVTFSQNRNMTNYSGNGYIYPAGTTTPSGSLTGSSFNMISSSFSPNNEITNISVTSSASGNAVIQMTINGDIYQSGYNADGSILAIGNTITNTTGANSNGQIGLVNQNDPNKILIFKYTSSTALSLSTPAQAQAFQTSLENAFGIGSSGNNNTGLSFQVGPSSNNIISVNIPGANTYSIFRDSGGTYQVIDISSQSDAEFAQTILINAFNNIISSQAQIGALESRLNYAQYNLESSQFNIQAATDNYLKTDFAAESVNLSQLLVQQQAATLALNTQSNLNQALLKLLG